jgi:hypothetical protein
MSSLTTIREAVRLDLKDASDALWSDTVLERHILRTVQDYSHVSPVEEKDTLQTDSDSREVDVSTLQPRIRIVAAEYPTGEYPPVFVPFTLWGEVLTLDVVEDVSGTPDVNVYWHGPHTVDGSGSTFPDSHDNIIVTGAAGYAALEWANYAANRVNVGGEHAWGRYMDFANVRLGEFKAMLRRLPAANTLRTGRLYTPVEGRFRTQTTDPGPL